jgi:tRNA G18 (ribose-2'-O)-methylase SpoU
MALSTPITETPEEVRALLAPLRHDFSVAVYACENAFAVGAIIRVAHSFLAREIVIIGNEPYYEKASMGMQKYESIVKCTDESAFFAHVGERPVWAFEKERARQAVYDVDQFPRHVVLLFGSERFGLPATVLDRVDHVVAIPMYGVNNSLPVAVAAGIAMNEWARRKHRPPRADGA